MAIKHKRKSTSAYTWTSGDLADGQIGLNTADGTIHIKKTDNSVVTIGGGVTSATQIEGGAPDSVYGGTTPVDGGTV